jgi:hypothetical protein
MLPFDPHKAIRLAERQGLQQHGVYDGEHRRAGAYTARQRRYRNEREAGTFSKLPESEAEVGEHPGQQSFAHTNSPEF